MVTQLLFASGNKGKIIEIREALDSAGISLLTPADLTLNLPEPEEHGATYTENALIKARHYFEAATMPTFADDSGIVIEALKNELGVQTRRWGAGPAATDEQWIEVFLKRMAKESNKRAAFLCTIAFIDTDGTEQIFDGRCDGVITETVEAPYLPGLPIAGCFRPDGFDRVFTALTIEEKNRISHRGKAVQQLIAFIRR